MEESTEDSVEKIINGITEGMPPEQIEWVESLDTAEKIIIINIIVNYHRRKLLMVKELPEENMFVSILKFFGLK